MVFAKGFKDGMFIGVAIINHGVEMIWAKSRKYIYKYKCIYIYDYEIKIRNSKCNAMIWRSEMEINKRVSNMVLGPSPRQNYANGVSVASLVFISQ